MYVPHVFKQARELECHFFYSRRQHSSVRKEANNINLSLQRLEERQFFYVCNEPLVIYRFVLLFFFVFFKDVLCADVRLTK